ncbi:iron(3+)-hydroxamate-binding protein fhuD, partial [Bacillus haynesii]|nr:iron(3+)-hydroxamate-binding protein fhuD [Bacillus haynesii]
MNIKGKTLASACFILFLIAALTACGNQAESKDSSQSKSEETITYKAENGTVKVPKHPKRVVVMA